jgi:rhomboid protease GluP
LTLCVYSLAIGATNPLVDNACHVGGLLGGSLAALFLVRPIDPAARASPQPRRLAAVTLGICAALFALAAPLALPNGSRGDSLRVTVAQDRFAEDEDRLVQLQKQILGAHKADQLSASETAARLEREVLQPWRQAMQTLLEIPPISQRDSPAARRRDLLRDYALARERALALTVDELRNPDERTDAKGVAAWHQVKELIDQIQALGDSE